MKPFLRHTSIQWKLLGAFLTMVIGFVVVALTAIELQLNAAERAAALEAEHVANAIATGIHDDATSNTDALQKYVLRAGTLFDRDIFVVDRHGVVIADTNGKGLGSNYVHPDIEMTMLDGTPRAFVGPDASSPGLAKQMVVPLHTNPAEASSPTVGAVVFEYTVFYDTLMHEARRAGYLTGLAALVLILLGLALAVRVTRSIVKPLGALQRGVTAIAADDYSIRVAVATQDEMGHLAAAFNRMAHDLDASVTARRKHLDELARTNLLLQDGIDKQRVAAQRIEHLAYHDNLTDLPNRTMFGNALSQAIHHARRYGRPLAVFFIDLDRFKQINDTLGHDAGDLLLQEVAKRLTHCLRASDTVARLGGDEFVVLVPELQNDSHAATVAAKILSAVSRPVALPGQELRVTASIGISRFPQDGADEQTLMKNADIAMYQAKEGGRNGFGFYDADRDVNSFERLAMESSLRRAIERQELVIHYQPKSDFRSGAISGMEALLRWQHPELGMVSPTKFIPLAEETGLIVPIGLWVLRTACQQTVAWQAQGLSQLVVAVNLSPRQFADDNLLVDIISILTDTGMDARTLELEITESMIMQDVEKARQLLMTLKTMGVRIAIDDFGTGYSSLSALKRLPIDTLKIDRSFIRDLETAEEDRGLTEAIISLGKTLKLHLVAEGVETREQASFLHNRGCDELQGFYFSKPVPSNEFEAFVKSHRASLGTEIVSDTDFGELPALLSSASAGPDGPMRVADLEISSRRQHGHSYNPQRH